MKQFLLLGGLLLSGCALTDPDQRPGEWHALNVNAANLAVMVADPHDLEHGATPAVDEADGQMAVAAIDRLHHNKLKELGDTGVAAVKANSTGGASGSGGG